MLETIRRCLQLIDANHKGRWVMLVAIALLVGLFELGAAVLIFVLLGLVAADGAPLSLPIIGDLRERFPNVEEPKLIGTLAVVMAVFFVARGGLYLFQSYLQNRVVHNAGTAMSTALLRNYLSMPYALHLRRNSAELIRNAYYSVLDVVMHALVPMVSLASEGLLVLSILVALLVTAPQVTVLVVALLAPVTLLLARAVQPRMQKLGSLNQDAATESLKAIQQGLGGVREIKLLAREEHFESTFAMGRSRLASSLYRRALLQDVPRVAIETAVMLFILAFLGMTVWREGSLGNTVAVLGLFAYSILRVLPSLNRILSHLNNLRFGLAAVENVYDDFILSSARDRSSTDGAELRFENALEVDHVHFRYPGADEDVLVDVSFSVRRGESIGIVGTTGSGKSTLVDVLLGLLTPTSGDVLVDGVSVIENPQPWHRLLALVPQTVFLLDDSIRRNVAFGLPDPEIDDQAVADALRTAQLRSFVQGLPDGLDTTVGERGIRLSGGQRQRVAIARALYRKPAILFLDEGTSALDNETESQLVASLHDLKGGRTLFTVAHRLSTVAGCDRIIVLEEGRVADIGGYEDLIARSQAFQRLARS